MVALVKLFISIVHVNITMRIARSARAEKNDRSLRSDVCDLSLVLRGHCLENLFGAEIRSIQIALNTVVHAVLLRDAELGSILVGNAILPADAGELENESQLLYLLVLCLLLRLCGRLAAVTGVIGSLHCCPCAINKKIVIAPLLGNK